MIRILIAEDSKVVSLLLKAIFEREPDMQVVGIADDGRAAVRMADALKPDVITMDIRMPEMDGFEATRLIMSSTPVPIVVISSSVDDEELRITFRALEEGAVVVLEKPVGLSHPDFDSARRELVDTVRAMSSVKVIRRWRPGRRITANALAAAAPSPAASYEAVAIGSSTGGPQALRTLLSALPSNFPLPIVIAQHMSPGFIGGLVAWLQGQSLLRIRLAEHRQPLVPATVYLAPDDFDLLVARDAGRLIVRLDQQHKHNGFRPSATALLTSVAQTCGGAGIGVLLTGMGCDGADGLHAMRRGGAHTIVQDEASAIVYGMPGAAVALDAVERVVKLAQMGAYLQRLAMPDTRKPVGTHG